MRYDQKCDSLKNSWHFSKNVILALIGISIIGLILRLNYFSPDIPLTLDALRYFWYANDLSLLINFPVGHNIANNGWPTFLAIFFLIFDFDNFHQYMLLQKIISLTISIFTIIPIYLLCKIFVKRSFAIIGAAIFCFEPRLIQNSLLGITEPLYILTITISMVLFLNNNTKFVFASFAMIAVSALVRSEALILLPVFSIMYILRFRNDRKQLFKYGLCLVIFFLVLTPMSLIRIDTMGDDALFSRVNRSLDFSVDKIVNQPSFESEQSNYLLNGIENFIKFLGWSMIPIFLLLIPIGFVLFLSKINYNKFTILLTLFTLTIPIFYALAQFSDTRYLFVLFPIFCIFASNFIEKLFVKKRHKNSLIVIVIGIILITTIIFLEINKIDSHHEFEAIEIAKIISEKTMVINHYLPESKYIQTVEMDKIKQFPIMFAESTSNSTIVIKIGNSSLKKSLLNIEDPKLTHLVVDQNISKEYRPLFFKDIFQNEDKYPYLVKIYDSNNDGFDYHVKIFEINYNLLS